MSRLLFCGLFGGNAGFVCRTFGVAVAVHKFDDRHRRHITIAETRFENAHIPTLTFRVARTEDVKKFGDVLLFFQLGRGLTAGVQIAALAKGDQLFDDPLQLLGLWQGGFDLLVLDQRASHVCEHRFAVFVCAV